MAVDTSTVALNSLLEKLRLDELLVPPRSWDSIPSHPASGASSHDLSRSSSSLYSTTSVSEPSLVKLGMNALQGVESALISIRELSALFCSGSADRSSHRIPSLWTRFSSTSALGDLITSIGQFGCIVFLLRRFVNYFATPDYHGVKKIDDVSKSDYFEDENCPMLKFSLINQAFSISVGKVLDGYISSLNTLSASISLRRCANTNDGGCLTSVGYSEITLLEVFLHTSGLRTQIEALGNVCSVSHLTCSFPLSSLEVLGIKAKSEFSAFPRGGELLSSLYTQLKVADPDHCTLLKFLFLQSYEPYYGFIRSWIYDGRFTDPYNEFAVECIDEPPIRELTDNGIYSCWSLPTIRVSDIAAAPCFLQESLVPLCRTGHQLQVIMKLLELFNSASTYNTYQEILPHIHGMTSQYSWCAFPLTFAKEVIEKMAVERAAYYQELLENIDNLDFSSHQASSRPSRRLQNFPKNINTQSSCGDDLIPLLANGRNQCLPSNKANPEVSSPIDEYSYDDDVLGSSECSSSTSSEEQNVADQHILASDSMGQSYLSALDFSFSFSTENTWQSFQQTQFSCSSQDLAFKINENSCHSAVPSPEENYIGGCASDLSPTPEFQLNDTKRSLWVFCRDHCKENEISWLPSDDNGLELLNYYTDVFESVSKLNGSNKDQYTHKTCTSSNIYSSTSWKQKYDSTIFCTNPTSNRGSFPNLKTVVGERCRPNCSDSFFEFTSVKDPLKACVNNLARYPRSCSGEELSVRTEALALGAVSSRRFDIIDYKNVIESDGASSYNVPLPLHNRGSEELMLHPNISGGSTWESLLSRYGHSVSRSTQDQKSRLVAAVDMPLDFVIKKSILDEILLQYNYISKLTIKLLMEGFKLQQHLLALRCYHFMELADWADLLIMSLWHRKWHVNQVDTRISEIQGVLELSLKRSSREADPNKDRLFVYVKGDDTVHLPASATGVHSFDFLGLGYEVDWPVNIILTPAALGIYAEIFNFLIQVKLAVFSVTDAWCSLKNCCPSQHKGEANKVLILIETRHKISHFVCTLQQYVQSQLSQVSWCRFQQSLKHEVRDMLDLESVHMAYLTESLHICFLSIETKPIATIIQNILQCVMDFRCCLTGSFLDAGSSNLKISDEFSQVNSIRTTFCKNIEELYKIYAHSPKHGELSISRFWNCLNYNDYYGGVMSKHNG